MTSDAAYERISSIDDGRTDVSPLVVLTITGKNTRIAAIAIFEVFSSGPNHWLVIGANAMIGTALAAIANGISARPRRRKRDITTADRTASALPTTQPPKASEKVYSPACQSCERLSQSVPAMADGAGSRKRCTLSPRTSSCQATMPSTSTRTAGSQSAARRPTSRPRSRGTGSTPALASSTGASAGLLTDGLPDGRVRAVAQQLAHLRSPARRSAAPRACRSSAGGARSTSTSSGDPARAGPT